MAGPFKLKSGNSTPFKQMGSSPAKQEGQNKTYPDSYTKKDIKFLEEQNEDVVREKDRPLPPGPRSDRKSTIKVKKTGKTLPHPKHPVTPPSETEADTSKGTLKGVTQFESDIVNPAKTGFIRAIKKLKKHIYDPAKAINRSMIEADKKKIKAVKDYFTKR